MLRRLQPCKVPGLYAMGIVSMVEFSGMIFSFRLVIRRILSALIDVIKDMKAISTLRISVIHWKLYTYTFVRYAADNSIPGPICCRPGAKTIAAKLGMGRFCIANFV